MKNQTVSRFHVFVSGAFTVLTVLMTVILAQVSFAETVRISPFITARSASDHFIPNFSLVEDHLGHHLYRGGRPKPQHLVALKQQYRVKTIINLENNMSVVNRERRVAAQMGIRFLSFPMSARVTPHPEQIDDILEQLENEDNYPIFLHCHHGRERTGLIVALYRVLLQKREPGQAYEEMLANGFRTRYHALEHYFHLKTGF